MSEKHIAQDITICYSKVEDVYIITFLDEMIFPAPIPDKPRLPPHTDEWRKHRRWSMFTHGVCGLLSNNTCYTKQLALTGWHLPEPLTEEHFVWLLQRAADKLRRMAHDNLVRHPVSQWAKQNLYAAEMLLKYETELTTALLKARHDNTC